MTVEMESGDLNAQPLERAWTLPSKWFIRSEAHELEQELIYRREWQLVGRMDQLSETGAYFTAEVAGEPILAVRDRDGHLRAFSNVCRHRAGPVAEGAGVRKVFMCRYHGWSYTLDGRLQGAPGFRSAQDFSPADICLPEIRLDTLGPLVFVNLDPEAPSLRERLTGLPEAIRRFRFNDLTWRYQGMSYTVACNWKTFLLNALECYHCQTIHPNTICQILDPRDFKLLGQGERWSYWRYPRVYEEPSAVVSGLHAGIQLEATRLPTPRAGLDESESVNFHSVYIFPNIFLWMDPEHVMVQRLIPTGPESMLALRDHYFEGPDTPEMSRARENMDKYREPVVAEDIDICEAVQRNYHSRLYEKGRYSPEREPLPHFFESLYRSLMSTRLGDG